MQREERKRCRIAGKEYVSTRGKIVSAKNIGADCHCRRKCYEVVPEEQRKALFDHFYQLNSYNEQNTYLYYLIKKTKTGRKRSYASDRRSFTYKYYVRLADHTEVQVCKEAFANMHGISTTKVRMLCEKMKDNIYMPWDERGRHHNRPNRLSEEAIEAAKQHVCSILESNRLQEFRQTSKRSVIGLNLSKMWSDFHKQQTSSSSKIKSWAYFRIFKGLLHTKYPHLITEGSENSCAGKAQTKDSSVEVVPASESVSVPSPQETIEIPLDIDLTSSDQTIFPVVTLPTETFSNLFPSNTTNESSDLLYIVTQQDDEDTT